MRGELLMTAEAAGLITASLKTPTSKRGSGSSTAGAAHQLYMKATGAMASFTANSSQ